MAGVGMGVGAVLMPPWAAVPLGGVVVTVTLGAARVWKRLESMKNQSKAMSSSALRMILKVVAIVPRSGCRSTGQEYEDGPERTALRPAALDLDARDLRAACDSVQLQGVQRRRGVW